MGRQQINLEAKPLFQSAKRVGVTGQNLPKRPAFQQTTSTNRGMPFRPRVPDPAPPPFVDYGPGSPNDAVGYGADRTGMRPSSIQPIGTLPARGVGPIGIQPTAGDINQVAAGSRDPFAGWTPPAAPSPGLGRSILGAAGRLAWSTFAPPGVQNANNYLDAWVNADSNPTVNRIRTGTPHPLGGTPESDAAAASAIDLGRRDAIGGMYGMSGPATPAVMAYHDQQQQRAAAIQGNYDLPDSPAARQAATAAGLRQSAAARSRISGTQFDESGNVTQGGNVVPFTPTTVTREPMLPIPANNGLPPSPLSFMDYGERTAPQVVGGAGHRILRRTPEQVNWDRKAIEEQQYNDAKRNLTLEQQGQREMQRAGRDNPIWWGAHQDRLAEQRENQQERGLAAKLQGEQRRARMAYRKQMALPPSPQTIAEMEFMRRNPGAVVAMRGQNVEAWNNMQRNQVAMRGQNMEAENNKQRNKTAELAAQAEADYNQAQADAIKRGVDFENSEEGKLWNAYQAVAQTNPAEAQRIYSQIKKLQAEQKRAAAQPVVPQPGAPNAAPAPVPTTAPGAQSAAGAASSAEPAVPQGGFSQPDVEDYAEDYNAPIRARFKLPANPAELTSDTIPQGLIANSKTKPGEAASEISDEELDTLGGYSYRISAPKRPTSPRNGPHVKWGIDQALRAIGNPDASEDEKVVHRKRARALAEWEHKRSLGATTGPTVDGYQWTCRETKFKGPQGIPGGAGSGTTYSWSWKKVE